MNSREKEQRAERRQSNESIIREKTSREERANCRKVENRIYPLCNRTSIHLATARLLDRQ
jgi:hypothetical protein